MAAYRRVYDSQHLQADCQRTEISSGTLHSVIEYGLPLPFFHNHRGSHAINQPGIPLIVLAGGGLPLVVARWLRSTKLLYVEPG